MMSLLFELRADDLLRLLAALVIGGIIGGEREYRSKAAGFRTLTLICLGSAVFTILSSRLGAAGSPDRIASQRLALDRGRQNRSYKVRFPMTRLSPHDLDRAFSRFGVDFALRKVVREEGVVSCWYDVWGHEHGLLELSDFFVHSSDILSVEYVPGGPLPDGSEPVGT
jgi:hypothetical protein